MARGKYKGVAKHRRKKKKTFSLLLSIVLLLTLATGGTLAYIATKSAMAQNQFEPGRVTSSVNVSGDTITVVNSNSNVDVYIRAAIVVNWMDGQGNVRGIAPTASDYSLNVNTASWWMDTATGLYYYKNSVAPGSSTDALVDGITVYGTVPDGYQLSVEVVAEAIQAEGETDIGDVPAYQNAWKITSISGS